MFAGVDTHKDTLAVAVIDHAGRVGCDSLIWPHLEG